MKRALFIFLAIALMASPASAGGSDDALSLVPPDAASVGLIRLDELRNSPLAAKIFDDTDRLAGDGDAARFFEETGLNPKRDVDLVVVAASPSAGGSGESGLVLFEGRFDPLRLQKAIESRGGRLIRTPHGDYTLLNTHDGQRSPGAVAFVSGRLAIAGTEAAVVRALSQRASGGSGFLRGEGIGRHYFRIEGNASAWALVDAVRYPLARRARGGSGDRGGDPSAALAGAMKSVSLFAFQVRSRGDSLDLSATGLTADAETRDLLEDALKGVVAMWRLAVQEKSPEMVSVLRKFEVESDGEGVTIRGTLPGSFIRTLTERSEKGRRAAK